MARTKRPAQIRRDDSFDSMDRSAGETTIRERKPNGSTLRTSTDASALKVAEPTSPIAESVEKIKRGSQTQLLVGVGGIYMSFWIWAILQERLTTTSYGMPGREERFKYTIFLNTIQSLFAATTGYAYLMFSTPRGQSTPPVFPTGAILPSLFLVAITNSLASPFGLAALSGRHVDYITYTLAKSCKLVPVMVLHVGWFRKRYPPYKYAIVALVTIGVAVFTTYHPVSDKKRASSQASNSLWGLALLGINLLFDGITNSVQDDIFKTHKPYSGPQMQVAQNVLSTVLTLSYLALSPFLLSSGIGGHFGMKAPTSGQGEFGQAMAFIQRHPSVGVDMLGYAACGAFGQLFIYYTLSNFDSILLVTVTVTRKMGTMILSVVWYGHRLTGMQWLGVGLVFGGIGTEAYIARREGLSKKKAAMSKQQGVKAQ